MCCESQLLGERSGPKLVETPDAGRNQSHLFKVDQVSHVGLVANVDEVGVLSHQRHEGDNRRCQFALQCSENMVITRGVLCM